MNTQAKLFPKNTLKNPYIRRYKLVEVEGYQLPLKGKPIDTTINSSRDANQILRHIYKDLDTYKEHFIILGLDRKNEVILAEVVSSGGTCGTIVDERIIANFLLQSLCHGVILAHNHPSGKTTPSVNDKQITASLTDGLKYIGIQVLDHVILDLNSSHYYSFADEGII